MNTFKENTTVETYNEEGIEMKVENKAEIIEKEVFEGTVEQDEDISELFDDEQDEAQNGVKDEAQDKSQDEEESDDDDDDISILSFKKTESKHLERIIGEVGILTIVNSKKNGRRLSFAAEVIKTLQVKEYVQIALVGKGIAVLPPGELELEQFKLKKEGSKYIIYSSSLVQEITKVYKLDYSNRTSITFPKVKYKEEEGNKFAYIKIA